MLRRLCLVLTVAPVLIAGVSLSAARPVLAAEPVLGTPDGPPPGEIAAEIRDALEGEGIRATLESGVNLDFWMRAAPPGGGGSNPAATFPDLAVGTLVGVVRIDGPWTDYKGNPIEPGVFTMRYGNRPEDGNHMGVSVHLDFVLLVPVAEDTTFAVDWGQAALNVRSFAATGVGHPAVMSLAPDYAGLTEPAIFEDDAGGYALGWPWESGLVLGLVVEGEGEH